MFHGKRGGVSLYSIHDELLIAHISSSTSIPATSTHATSSGAASAPKPVNTGVLNGSRMTIMDPRTGGDMYLYYQYGDGSLHYISQSPEHIWQGVTNLQVTNARMGTPLAAISTLTNGSVIVSGLRSNTISTDR